MTASNLNWIANYILAGVFDETIDTESNRHPTEHDMTMEVYA